MRKKKSKNKTGSRKALLYVRVSSDEQKKEGFSLDDQLKRGREYAMQCGLNIVKCWSISESAWKWTVIREDVVKTREAFGRMVKYAIQHPEITDIIFDSADRLTRNDFDKAKISLLLKHYKKTIHFAATGKTMRPDSQSDDKFMFDIECAAAEKLSTDISIKAKGGMKEKAMQGYFAGYAPLGYKNDKYTEKKFIKVDPERAPFIRRAFELMATGNYSIGTLVDKLYKEGLRTRHGNKVVKSTLATYLNNPIYCGHFYWKKVRIDGKHTPIIKEQLFDQVQEILNGRRIVKRKTSNNFPFQGVARCATCNCIILGELVKKKYLYYHCGFSKGRHEGAKYIRSEQMPILFGDTVKAVTVPEELADWLLEAVHNFNEDDSRYREERIVVLKRERTKIQGRISKLVDGFLDGEFDEDILNNKKNELNERKHEIDIELVGLESDREDAFERAKELLELCKRLYDIYFTVDDEKKAQILRVIGSNYILDGLTLSVTYNKPFNFLANLDARTMKLPS
jgi:DNA invertase Pin-like site-specific DNA recombinase